MKRLGPVSRFVAVLILYIFVSIVALLVFRWWVSSIPGDLSRWLAYGTILQAVIASAAIVALTAILVSYTGRAEEILRTQAVIQKDQTLAHQRIADTTLASKIEENIVTALNLTSDLRSAVNHILCIYIGEVFDGKTPINYEKVLSECAESVNILRLIGKKPELEETLNRHLCEILEDREGANENSLIKKIAQLTKKKIIDLLGSPASDGGAFLDVINLMDTSINIGIAKYERSVAGNGTPEPLIPLGYLYPAIIILNVMPSLLDEYIVKVIGHTANPRGDKKRDTGNITNMIPVLVSMKNEDGSYEKGLEKFFYIERTIDLFKQTGLSPVERKTGG
jgi:hypothetical protein